jgi:branched-chain amino acid transport system substrate-binding protein
MNNDMFSTILGAAAEGLGRPLEKIAFVYSDNPATLGLIATWREVCEREGIELVVDELYTPPLRDATPIMLKCQAEEPDIYVTYAGGVTDEVLMWTSARDLELDEKMAMFTYTGANPITVKALGELTERVFSLTDWNMMETAASERMVELYVNSDQKYEGFDFLPKDTALAYGVIWTIKEALEISGDPDPTAVKDALKDIDITEGPATVLFGRVRYSKVGEHVDCFPFIFQWQGSYPDVWPETVFPTEWATAEMDWPTG